MRMPKLFPIALIAYAALFYLLAVNDTSWYTFVLLGIILAERLIVQLGLFLAQRMAFALVQRAMDNAAAMAQQGPHSNDDLPPMTGGRIDPPDES